jgi:hypothetical protein
MTRTSLILFVSFFLSKLLFAQSEIKCYEIPVVHIEGMSAKQIVKKAIDKIPDNFAADTFYSKIFYRQYHKENNFYVRLIEASLFFKSTVEKNKNSLNGRERVRVIQLRRSNNYEMNKEEHGDHLFDLLSENPVYHSLGTVLNRKALNSFKFFPDTIENDSVYHIFYFSKNSMDEKVQKGELLIDKRTFAILKFTKEERQNDNAVSKYDKASSVPYCWEFQNGNVIAEYEYRDGKMFLASLNKTYTHELYDNKVHSKEYVVAENFELKVDSDFYSQNILPGNFSAVSNLYHLRYPYDRDYWNNYLTPGFVFENSKIVIRDLQRKETLEQQFEKNSANLFADK